MRNKDIFEYDQPAPQTRLESDNGIDKTAPDQVTSYWFNKIWDVIKDWDINNEPAAHKHVTSILQAITTSTEGKLEEFDEDEQWR